MSRRSYPMALVANVAERLVVEAVRDCEEIRGCSVLGALREDVNTALDRLGAMTVTEAAGLVADDSAQEARAGDLAAMRAVVDERDTARDEAEHVRAAWAKDVNARQRILSEARDLHVRTSEERSRFQNALADICELLGESYRHGSVADIAVEGVKVILERAEGSAKSWADLRECSASLAKQRNRAEDAEGVAARLGSLSAKLTRACEDAASLAGVDMDDHQGENVGDVAREAVRKMAAELDSAKVWSAVGTERLDAIREIVHADKGQGAEGAARERMSEHEKYRVELRRLQRLEEEPEPEDREALREIAREVGVLETRQAAVGEDSRPLRDVALDGVRKSIAAGEIKDRAVAALAEPLMVAVEGLHELVARAEETDWRFEPLIQEILTKIRKDDTKEHHS